MKKSFKMSLKEGNILPNLNGSSRKAERKASVIIFFASLSIPHFDCSEAKGSNWLLF